MEKSGPRRKGRITVKAPAPSRRQPAAERVKPVTAICRNACFVHTASSLTITLLLLFFTPEMTVYGDSLSEIRLMSPPDSLPATAETTPSNDEPAQPETVPDVPGTTPAPRLSKKVSPETVEGLTNIVPTTKTIRASGWGEYRVGGRCLCCDNMVDGDCIIVHNTNRTEKKRLKQIVDGTIDADTADPTTFFGEVKERDRDVLVTMLMVELSLKDLTDIHRVIVYTIMDGAKKRSQLSNCALGYYDRFDRLQWAGKVENNVHDDHITFAMDTPIHTKTLLLKIQGGKNKITEVALFSKSKKE